MCEEQWRVSTPPQNKCTSYWPEPEEAKTFGKVHVLSISETKTPNYILRELLVHHEDDVSGGRGGGEGGGGSECILQRSAAFLRRPLVQENKYIVLLWDINFD